MSDLIDRQEAIDAIRASTSKYTGFMEMEMYTDDDAVEAIINLPSAQPELAQDLPNACTDAISRRAAIDAINALHDKPNAWLDCAVDAVMALPSAQPEPHYDEWCTDCKEYDQERHCCPRFDRVIKTTIDEIKTEQRWVPCGERLPETHKAGNSVSGIFMQSKPVLVYGVPEYESEYSFNVVTYCDDMNGITYWSTEMYAVTINEVTAWMPLPEPYKAGG